ncbi:MAG: DeoR/GlpR transcriptional regulator [Lawsonibacter sp.]|nr:DeoR/GlpR transcriptional regulator [Lawsonibacter sp.]
MRKARESQILELLSQCGRMEVSVLAQRLGVSQVTVRKDLDALEERGILRREHGFAVSGSGDDVNNRLAIHYEEKHRIARRAARLVSPGETVMIESGSCCALLAEEIARSKPGATIITNSAFIASYIRRVDGARVVLLGGDFQNDAQVMVGPILKVCAQQFYVERLFVGADGWSPALGFTGNNHLRVQAVRDMAEHAGQVIVVTESEKFSQRGVVPLNLPAGASAVVTDCGLTGEQARRLSEAGTEIYQAEEESAL